MSSPGNIFSNLPVPGSIVAGNSVKVSPGGFPIAANLFSISAYGSISRSFTGIVPLPPE
jgi:hypothetical protein